MAFGAPNMTDPNLRTLNKFNKLKKSMNATELLTLDKLNKTALEIKTSLYRQAYYNLYVEKFRQSQQKLLSMMQVELVVYDETETFRESNDIQFNYPYSDRKQIIGTYKLKFENEATSDTMFYINNIKMYKSAVCLELPFYN
jgi:hypothetical protein